MAALTPGFAHFPLGKLFWRTVVGLVPLAAGFFLHGWVFWAGLILSAILSYFLVGLTLYRNATPWRRIGHQGFYRWVFVTAGLEEGRRLGATESDYELRERALACTLRHIYAGLDSEEAHAHAARYIADATGTGLANELFEYLTRRGRPAEDAATLARNTARALQEDKNIGRTIIVFTLARIIGREFGVIQKDLYWQAVFRREMCAM